MIEIRYTPEFVKRYNKLSVSVQKKAEQKEKIFRANPFHPSLNTEKLKPKEKEYWSLRIDLDYRIIFRFLTNNKIVFVTCGHHNWIYKFIITH